MSIQLQQKSAANVGDSRTQNCTGIDDSYIVTSSTRAQQLLR